MIYALYNTAHPLAESGKPIFIPFGEWPYDKTTRQRLDREHGEAIANELNERVARGEPGIPVYQGHPDVPDLAAKYPDKGALGWVTHIDLVNEAAGLSSAASAKEGLSLTVEWDRDPGKGFKWFSPYWFANEKDRDGQTYIVANIRSIGLVNNPNIPEFRLANERNTMNPYQLPQNIIDLANEFDESKHPRASDGKWTFAPGGDINDLTGGSLPEVTPELRARGEAMQALRKSKEYHSASRERQKAMLDTETQRILRKKLYASLEKKVGTGMALELSRATGLSELDLYGEPAKVERAAHRAAILSGLKFNRATHQYE